MKEKEFKNIIKKGTIETSDDFINTVMTSIQKSQDIKKVSFWKTLKVALIASTILISGLTFILLKSNITENDFFHFLSTIPKMLVFVVITLFLLLGVNSLITLSEQKTKKSHF